MELANAIKSEDFALAKELCDLFCDKDKWFKRAVRMMSAIMYSNWDKADSIADSIIEAKLMQT